LCFLFDWTAKELASAGGAGIALRTCPLGEDYFLEVKVRGTLPFIEKIPLL
jgi:hypothetical protein